MEIKQILLITDGRSNIGGDPVLPAARAADEGITVNTIGIIDDESDERSADEIKAIARAGKGTWQIVSLDMLPATVCSITHRTVQSTLESIVNRQIERLLGPEIKNIEPAMRLPLMRYADELAENTALKCIILVDCSNSMAAKLKTARAAIIDLLASFKIRKAGGCLAVIAFPGQGTDTQQLICPFTSDLELLKRKLNSLQYHGNTPTAPAIDMAVHYMLNSFFYGESMLSRSQQCIMKPFIL